MFIERVGGGKKSGGRRTRDDDDSSARSRRLEMRRFSAKSRLKFLNRPNGPFALAIYDVFVVRFSLQHNIEIATALLFNFKVGHFVDKKNMLTIRTCSNLRYKFVF
jgi:hypothetical protein